MILSSCSAESREINKAQQAVKDILIDPNSATFRNVRSAVIGICGEVNAKNSFNGYTGYKKFHYSPETAVIIESDNNISTINIICEKSE